MNNGNIRDILKPLFRDFNQLSFVSFIDISHVTVSVNALGTIFYALHVSIYQLF